MDLDHLFKEQGAYLLQAMAKLIDANMETLDGLLSARIDGVHGEVMMELEQLRGEMPKEVTPSPPPPCDGPSLLHLARNGRNSAANDFLGIDNDHRGMAHNPYVSHSA
ncbi:hypothetical protein D1007_38693 [Hordeum vulgare]|nr:hypothetical protein D1007_38693 [Hordeum vulgare]